MQHWTAAASLAAAAGTIGCVAGAVATGLLGGASAATGSAAGGGGGGGGGGKIMLTYLDIPGIAEPIRLALVIGGLDFEDIRVWPAYMYRYSSVATFESQCRFPGGALLGGKDRQLKRRRTAH